MSVRVLIPLGKGFEEVEAISVIDVLRRVGCEVILAAVDEESQKALVVESQSGLKVSVNVKITEVLASSIDSIVLPGGWEGTQNLIKSKEVGALLADLHKRGRVIGAICAAPLALFKHNILINQNFTCYPSIEENIANQNYIPHQAVVKDGNLITSRGPATALCFGFALAKELVGEAKTREVQRGMLAYEFSKNGIE